MTIARMRRAANKSLEPTVLSVKHFAWSKMLATEPRGSACRWIADQFEPECSRGSSGRNEVRRKNDFVLPLSMAALEAEPAIGVITSCRFLRWRCSHENRSSRCTK